MKSEIIKSLKELVKDRYLLVLLVVFLLVCIVYATVMGLSIHSSERQVISHYSAFGVTHFYFDQWFYLLSFLAFGLTVAVMHTIIAIKLLIVKGHSLAVLFAWASIGIILLGWSTASTVLSLRTLL
ncbi:MAG: hypothetical protein WA087_01615 [Candidatus Saccharimonadales bacterium]